MRHSSIYRVGGNALLLGAVAVVIGLLLHADPPADIEAAAAIGGAWVPSHWLLVLGSVLLLGGFVAMLRHFADTPAEGWAGVALGAVVFGLVGLGAASAREAMSFPLLVDLYEAGGEGAADAVAAFTALRAGDVGLVAVASTFFWLGIAAFGVAMLRDEICPRWAGYAGIAVGLLVAIAGPVVGGDFPVYRIVFILGAAWVGATGAFMARMGRGAPAPVERATPAAPTTPPMA